MGDAGSRLGYVALVFSGLALAAGFGAYGTRPEAAREAAIRSASPATVSLSVVAATFSGPGIHAHRWYPTVIMARVGDTVDLAVANPDEFAHQFELAGYDQKTKVLRPGESHRLTFVAEQVGVFAFQCVLLYNPGRKQCTPDHAEMRGYLIVSAR